MRPAYRVLGVVGILALLGGVLGGVRVVLRRRRRGD
jgi:hypothetical protein